eukprot:TRINITY_DN29189_c0_g1_i1.p1 TRINITY_DN29189_c0_g1~~TRINITY_DN29189_c0_g1_i1.p1  ORF type:complete len:899 (-),score=106.57 TRINITY_DN29189_c0_g1_i1:1-2697(-)
MKILFLVFCTLVSAAAPSLSLVGANQPTVPENGWLLVPFLQTSASSSAKLLLTITASSGTVTFSNVSSSLLTATSVQLVNSTLNSSSVILRGSTTSLNYILGSLAYVTQPRFNGKAVVTALLCDNLTPALCTELAFFVTVSPVNDPPAIYLPATQSMYEGGVLQLPPIGLSDDAGPTDILLVTASVSGVNGTLSVVVGAQSIGGQQFSISGTLSTLQTAFSAVTFRPAQHLNGVATIQFVFDDRGAGAAVPSSATALQTTATLNVVIIAVNDPPEIQFAAIYGVWEDVPFPIGARGFLKIDDVDSGTGIISVHISVVNGLLTLGCTDLTYCAKGNNTMSLSFNAPLQTIQRDISSLVYTTRKDYNGPDSMNVTVNDNGLTGFPGTISPNIVSRVTNFTVLSVNDPPVIGTPFPAAVFTDEDVPVPIATLTYADVDVDDCTAPPCLTMWGIYVNSGRVALATVYRSKFTLLSGNATGSLSLSGTGTIGSVAQQSSQLWYVGDKDWSGEDILRVVLSDLGNTGDDNTTGVTEVQVRLVVAPVNDAPQITYLGSSVTLLEDSWAVVPVSISDVDATDGAQIQVTIAVTYGRVTVDDNWQAFVTNGASSLTIVGTLSTLQAALQTLKYYPNKDYNSREQPSETLRITANDGGCCVGTSLSVPQIGIIAIPIFVVPVNDPPVIAAPVSVLTELQFNVTVPIAITDVDLQNGFLTVRLNVSIGYLFLSSTTGLKFTKGKGSADRYMEFSGSGNAVKLALSGLIYTNLLPYPDPISNIRSPYYQTDFIQIWASDNGFTGNDTSNVQTSAFVTTVVIQAQQFPTCASFLTVGGDFYCGCYFLVDHPSTDSTAWIHLPVDHPSSEFLDMTLPMRVLQGCCRFINPDSRGLFTKRGRMGACLHSWLTS